MGALPRNQQGHERTPAPQQLAPLFDLTSCDVGFADGSQIRPFSSQQNTRKQKER
jgi:hypothetical protein